MISLAGKTALVTGATNGIGFETALALARAGAYTIIVGRNPARAQGALEKIGQRAASGAVEAMSCDFSSQAAVRRLAAEFGKRHKRLHVLVNNAGGVNPRRVLTEDGIEKTFAVNHLGSFLLTNLLLDSLRASAPARIVNVASVAHRRGRMDFDDLNFDQGYGIMRAYARSKLANVLFTRALARRLAGSGVTVNAVHPGTVATGIWRSGAPPRMRTAFAFCFTPIERLFMRTPAAGAEPVVRLAASPEVERKSGLYFDRMREQAPSEAARDNALAERLWAESARLTGLGRLGI